MEIFQETYDRCRNENQLLRDALIQCKRDMEIIKKHGVNRIVEKQWTVPEIRKRRRFFWISSRYTNDWLPYIMPFLSEDDILLADDPSFWGKCFFGVPICHPDIRNNMEVRSFVYVIGENSSTLSNRLQFDGYQNGIDFQVWESKRTCE